MLFFFFSLFECICFNVLKIPFLFVFMSLFKNQFFKIDLRVEIRNWRKERGKNM